MPLKNISTFFHSVQTIDAGDLVDSPFLARLIDILKTPSQNLQKKAASILEYFTINKLCVEKIISADVASGLDCLFQQNSLSGKEDPHFYTWINIDNE